jgi:hypothetical protein
MPLLESRRSTGREALIWHAPNYIGPGHKDFARPCGVVRKREWKMIESLEDGSVELYNLEADPSETTNLAEVYPERVIDMQKILWHWREVADVQMPVPHDTLKHLVN